MKVALFLVQQSLQGAGEKTGTADPCPKLEPGPEDHPVPGITVRFVLTAKNTLGARKRENNYQIF